MNRNTLASIGPVLLLLVPIVVWYPRLLFGYVISPNDVVYTWYPWRAYPPPGYLEPSNPFLSDFTRQFLPWAQFAAASIRQGSFPLWNPLTGTGAPLIGNSQSAIFSPFNFLYYMLDPSLATTLQTILKLLLPGFFMYLWMRERRVDVSAALVAGLAFMLSGIVFRWAMYPTPYVWIPLGFLAVDRIIQRPTIRWICALAAVTCLELVSGQPEFSIVTGFAQLSYLAYMVMVRSPAELQGFPNLKRVLMATAAAYGLAFATASAQLLPDLEYILGSETLSVRTSVSWNPYAEQLFPSNPVFAIFPELLGIVGPIVLSLALYSLFASKRKTRYFFAGLAIFAGLFNYVPGLGRFVPLLNLIRPRFMGELIPLSLCVLAGFGAERIFNSFSNLRSSLKWVLVLSSVLIIPILLLFLDSGVPVFWRWNEPSVLGIVGILAPLLVLAGIMSLGRMRRLSRRSIKGLILLLIISSMITFGMNYNPEVQSRLVYPVPTTPAINYLLNDKGIFRILAMGSELLPDNTGSYFGLDDVQLYDAITPVYYGELLRLATDWQGAWSTSITAIRNFNLLRVMNVKYVLTPPDVDLGFTAVTANSQMQSFAQEGLVKLVYHGIDGNIFLVNGFIQRAFVVHRVSVIKDDDAAKAISSPEFDPTKMAIVSDTSNVPSSAMMIDHEENATILKYGAESISVEVTTKNDGYLILSDTYFAGWQATIDGLAVPILRADICFRSVFLQTGTHIVLFNYAPGSFRLGMQISLTALVLMTCMLVIEVLAKKGLFGRRKIDSH